MYVDYSDNITWEKNPAAEFVDDWSSTGKTFHKPSMVGICFTLEDATGEGLKLTVTEVTFINVGALDKSGLSAIIATAKALSSADYTADSWAGVTTALAAAEAVFADTAATKTGIKGAITALQDAVDALVPAEVVDKTALAATIATADTKVEASYTRHSWSAFKTVLTSAKTTHDANNSTQEQIDAANTALNTAMTALVAAIPDIAVTVGSSPGISAKVIGESPGGKQIITLSGNTLTVPRNSDDGDALRFEIVFDTAQDLSEFDTLKMVWTNDGTYDLPDWGVYGINLSVRGGTSVYGNPPFKNGMLTKQDFFGAATTGFEFYWNGRDDNGALDFDEMYIDLSSIEFLDSGNIGPDLEDGLEPDPSVTIANIVSWGGSTVTIVDGTDANVTFVTKDGTPTLKLSPGAGGSLRLKLTPTPAYDISSFTKIVIKWTDSEGDSGASYNIGMDFSGGGFRQLSGWMNSDDATASIAFTEIPSWAADWGSDPVGSLTKLEIFSEQAKGNLYITSISFE
jgi:hypothetical protein